MNNKDKEIEILKEEISELKNDSKKEQELNQLRDRLKKLKFRKEHPKLLNLTMGLEQGTKRIFRSIGSGISKAGKAIEKSDRYIAEQQRKECELKLNKGKKKQKGILDDASLGID